MSTTTICSVAAAAVYGSDGIPRYLMLEQSYEGNAVPQTPHWSAVFFGTGEECLRRAAERSIGCSSGMTQMLGAADRYSSAAYIALWKQALANPIAWDVPESIAFKIGSGYDCVEWGKAVDIGRVFVMHRLLAVSETDRATGRVQRSVTSRAQYADILADMQSVGVPLWKFLPGAKDLKGLIKGEEGASQEFAYASRGGEAIPEIAVHKIPGGSLKSDHSRIAVSVGPAYICSIPSLGMVNAYAEWAPTAIDRMIRRVIDFGGQIDSEATVRAIESAVANAPEVDRAQKVRIWSPEPFQASFNLVYAEILDAIGAPESRANCHCMGNPDQAGFDTTVGALIDARVVNSLRLLQPWQIAFASDGPENDFYLQLGEIQTHLATFGFRMKRNPASLPGEGHDLIDIYTGEIAEQSLPEDGEVRTLARAWNAICDKIDKEPEVVSPGPAQ